MKENYNIKFTTRQKNNKNNGIITNILKLNEIQFNQLFNKILKLNSNLTKKQIGLSRDYIVRETGTTKKT